jgi:UDP-N-acetylglucosamine--N-acetylmuramyl-(pentapeptide) pyrophosphoryl-undecaprenol N-acetylglucosamine transferase
LRAGGRAVRELPHLDRSPRPLLANIRRAASIVRKERPRLVICSGAGLVVPFCLLARLTGARVVFVETMARVHSPSASGRILSRLARTVIVQWPEMTRVYRRAILCRPALFEAVASAPAGEGRGTFVALGLHAPFDRLLAAVDRALDVGVLEPPVIVQAGPSGYRSRNFEAVPYLSPDQVRDAVSRARHVVCHAGAGIISTSLRAGRRPLVMPRRADQGEHVDDHQLQIVDRLAAMGLVVPIGTEIREAEARAGAESPPPIGADDLPSVGLVLAGAVQ